LEDKEVLQLANWGIIIEEHYCKRKGKKCPMDIEWAKDGNTNEIFIVQARPETAQCHKDRTRLVCYKLKGKRTTNEESLKATTEENAKELKEIGDNEEKPKTSREKREEKEEDAEEEDDLKLKTPKKHNRRSKMNGKSEEKTRGKGRTEETGEGTGTKKRKDIRKLKLTVLKKGLKKTTMLSLA